MAEGACIYQYESVHPVLLFECARDSLAGKAMEWGEEGSEDQVHGCGGTVRCEIRR